MLFEIYSHLTGRLPESRAHLFGSQIERDGKLWLSITEQAFPCLLFPSHASEFRTDIALRFIDVEFSRECEIATDGAGATVGTYTIVRLNENDPDVVRLFLRLLEEAFCRGSIFNNRQIGDKILELADLFGRLENAAGDILGLWGELYVIGEAENVLSAVSCWCSHKNAKYDFVANEFALEVKTTVKSKRQHTFSIEQLRPVNAFEVYITSLQLIETSSGKTFPDLLESILAQIESDDLRSAFLNHCLVKGGRDLYRNSLSLQPFPDKSSLAILDANDIPVPYLEAGTPISNVRFDVDLSGIPRVAPDLRGRILAFSAHPAEG
jgi:hypothetical protein